MKRISRLTLALLAALMLVWAFAPEIQRFFQNFVFGN
jgi:hypothetical protein